jgi:hypothetical protein
MAIINSLSAVNRMCIDNIFVKAGSDIPFDIEYFDDSEAAIHWATGA